MDFEWTLVPKFQFQIGAIGSVRLLHTSSSTSSFQFQIGAIGRLPDDDVTSFEFWFQFQIGAIGSRSAEC